jgi:BolA family transcriptional regulator, general stress-responsive regulator
MMIAHEIERLLKENLTIYCLKVTNLSDQHVGHAGHDGSGESHFHVEIEAEEFIGRSRVACHQMIYKLLDELLKTKIHALAIEARIPAKNQP